MKEQITALRQFSTERYILSTLPVLYLPLWKRDGATFLSDDGFGHSCTRVGALLSQGGNIFDGDDYISAGNNAILRPVTELTLEFWFKPVATTGYICGMPYSTGWGTPYNSYQIYYNSNGSFAFNPSGDAPGIISGTAGDAPAGVWYHAVYIHRATGTRWEAYLNTVSYGTSAGGDPSYSGSPKFSIGVRNADSLGEYGKGTIGEVRVYNRALTFQEIQRNYLATKWRYR